MKKWIIKNTKADLGKMSQALKVDKLICKIISNRGLSDIASMNRFLWEGRESLYSPDKLNDMDKSVDIVLDAIDSSKRIRIIGDYDQDGISATYILTKGLEKIGGIVDYDIPERTRDGYGINTRLIDQAKDDSVDLLITCDNGIAANREVDYARSLGMKIIVTDHHDIPYIEKDRGQLEYIMPEADAVINPKRIDSTYPFPDICGATVAFKLLEAIYKERGITKAELEEFYQFVAMATVCDVMDLIDENRILVKEGLQNINKTDNLGLASLIEKTGLADREIGGYHLGFVIGPCINATGRLESAKTAVELFLEKDKAEADKKAELLYSLNEERKQLTNRGIELLQEKIDSEGYDSQKVLVLFEESIHESIAGIIAGRIRERYNKPVIVLTSSEEDGMAKGSGRSIEAYNMFKELSRQKSLFERFGGHPMAAGLSIKIENIGRLREVLNRDTSLREENFIEKVYLDAQIPIDKLNKSITKTLSALEPFGKSNAKPLFGDKDIGVKKIDILGKNYRIMKFKLAKGNMNDLEAIYFGDLEEMEGYIRNKFGDMDYENVLRGIENSISLDIVYYPNINSFRGRESLQIVIKDYR